MSFLQTEKGTCSRATVLAHLTKGSSPRPLPSRCERCCGQWSRAGSEEALFSPQAYLSWPQCGPLWWLHLGKPIADQHPLGTSLSRVSRGPRAEGGEPFAAQNAGCLNCSSPGTLFLLGWALWHGAPTPTPGLDSGPSRVKAFTHQPVDTLTDHCRDSCLVTRHRARTLRAETVARSMSGELAMILWAARTPAGNSPSLKASPGVPRRRSQ